jgi:hypothetical protein
MEKVQYDHQPPKLEAVGNGSHLYRWGITERTIENPMGEPHQVWECFEVLVWNEPTREKVIIAAIEAVWPAALESKLQNDYIAAREGLIDSACKIPYLDFITQKNILKNEINTYFDYLDIDNGYIELGWHHPSFQKRIVAPVQLVMQYPAIETWFRINDLPIVRIEGTLYCYCNLILPEHQALVNSLQGIVSIEDKPVL